MKKAGGMWMGNVNVEGDVVLGVGEYVCSMSYGNSGE